ncbi:MAG: hypothetical protein ABI905_13170 [Betaproteobacteria bacterium]
MDDLKTRIRTKQCEFEIQLDITTRLAMELQDLKAQEYEGEAHGLLRPAPQEECAWIFDLKD